MSIANVLIAVLIGVAVWRVSMGTIRLLSTPPPQIDPDDVIETRQDYKCTVCGAELTMTAHNVREVTAPKHCREEMVAVWRP